jgi:hypothetical protein
MKNEKVDSGVNWLALAVIFTLFAWVFGGCSAQGLVSANNIKPAVRVITDEHKAYVLADPTLSDAEKAKRIRTNELLWEVVDDAASADEVLQ